MSKSMAASHAVGKKLKDAIFGASGAAVAAAAKYGEDKVVNATIGAIMDDAGHLSCIPTMEKTFRSLPIGDLIAYAPISGLPANSASSLPCIRAAARRRRRAAGRR